jgi:hypothetical protein
MCSITAISRLPENLFTKTSSSWLAFLVKDRDLMGLKDVLHRFHAASPNMHWLVEEQIEKVTRSSADSLGRAPFEQNFWAFRRPSPSVQLGDSSRPHRRWENQGYQIYHRCVWN